MNMDIGFRVLLLSWLRSKILFSLFSLRSITEKTNRLIQLFPNTCGYTTREWMSPCRWASSWDCLASAKQNCLEISLCLAAVFCTIFMHKHIVAIGSRKHLKLAILFYTSSILIFNCSSIILWKISKDFR